MNYWLRLIGGVAFAATLAILALTGCASPFGAPAKAATADPRQAMLHFAQCMRQHGITMPDPSSDGSLSVQTSGPDSGSGSSALGPGPGDPAFQAAQTACQKYMPSGGPGTLTKQEAKAAQEKGLKFAQCMRQHGLPDFPDPQTNPNGGGTTFQGVQDSGGPSAGGGPKGVMTINGQTFQVDPSSPEFQKAQQACSSILGIKGGLPNAAPPSSSGH
jgi:hypothetical protein